VQVIETGLIIRDALDRLEMPSLVKTTGSKGLHIYIPIERGPNQKEVWTFAKAFAQNMAGLKPKLITAEYRIERRPPNHVLVDYNQNAWGRTLASVYSVRPTPQASVSTPVTWAEVKRGLHIDDFRIDNVRERVKKLGDLWAPLVAASGRVKLEQFL
jgi:bifunctional non-homologous end joining protein LigD